MYSPYQEANLHGEFRWVVRIDLDTQDTTEHYNIWFKVPKHSGNLKVANTSIGSFIYFGHFDIKFCNIWDTFCVVFSPKQ